MTDTKPPSPLAVPAVCLITGLAAARYFVCFPYSISAALLCAALLFVRFHGSRPALKAVGLLFAAFGFCSYFAYGPGASSVAGSLPMDTESKVTGTVVRPPEEREGYTLAFLEPDRGRPYPSFTRSGLIRLKIIGTGVDVRYGDRLTGTMKLRRPEGYRNPGVFDWGEYARLNGEDATASVKPAAVSVSGRAGSLALRSFYDMRQEVARSASASLAPEDAAIYRAMVLGDQGKVAQPVRDVFSASGTTHILSVSGSHIALFASLIFILVRLATGALPARAAIRFSLRADWRKAASALALPAAAFYCLLAGSEVATVRAFIMLAVFMAAILLDREADILNTLAASALIALVSGPSALFDISFQLSYGCVLAMAVADRAWPRPRAASGGRLAGRTRRQAYALYISAAALVCTAPLVAGQFNTFSWVSIPANIVIVPLAGMVLVPLGLLSAVLHIISPAASLQLAGLNGLAIESFMSVVRAFASMPSANLHPPAPGFIPTVLFYACIAAAVLWKATPRARLAGALAAVLVFSLTGFVHWDVQGRLRVVFFDVGHGDSALVQFPDGKTMLVDAGGMRYGADPGRASIAPYLWNHGIRRLDYVVISHPHPDHFAGLFYLMENFGIGQIWEAGTDTSTGGDKPAYRCLIALAKARGIPCYKMCNPGEASIGGASVQILGVSRTGGVNANEENEQENNGSLVIRVSYGKASFLFTGDIQPEAEEEFARSGMPLASTVMKVPHHGGKSSLCGPFFGTVSPKAAVISTGVAGRYPTPSPETVEALEAMRARVLITSREGAATFSSDGRTLDISTYESARPRPAHNIAGELGNYLRLLGEPDQTLTL